MRSSQETIRNRRINISISKASPDSTHYIIHSHQSCGQVFHEIPSAYIFGKFSNYPLTSEFEVLSLHFAVSARELFALRFRNITTIVYIYHLLLKGCITNVGLPIVEVENGGGADSKQGTAIKDEWKEAEILAFHYN